MQISSNETTPSDVEEDDDDDDDDDTNNEDLMDETDFSITKIIIPRTNLDNRRTSNVFCCGDTKGSSVLNKLLGGKTHKKKSTGPGQAVQVVTTEYGVTEVLDEDGVCIGDFVLNIVLDINICSCFRWNPKNLRRLIMSNFWEAFFVNFTDDMTVMAFLLNGQSNGPWGRM